MPKTASSHDHPSSISLSLPLVAAKHVVKRIIEYCTLYLFDPL
ncbi:hypothetical protein NBRC111894_502 [Sporolactobacillus inulinus]|uniref:Uncharacterized protein n=1 Tax=Sporolactobacillus inulinus TaxID=2078 RepID=A0A4Y1Z7L9_9BACL|nr:hypothetical protein NBRC111894_502 [Sporolactobacillus inulinus]